MASRFLRWKNHVERLLRFNHMTMTLSTEHIRTAEYLSQTTKKGSASHSDRHFKKHHRQTFVPHNVDSTATIQYAFDSTSNFPRPFLNDAPRFHSSFDPSIRHLPCVLFLHGSDPGGFDVSRWMAGGLSHVHQLRNPLMPGQFGSYSVYNVQQRPWRYDDALGRDLTDPPDPAWSRLASGFPPDEAAASHSPRSRFLEPMPPLGLLSLSRPGYLESTPIDASMPLSAQATSIAQLVENLRVPSLHIIAHGIAALVALEMASLAGFRNRVRSISLIDGQLSPPKRSQRLSQRLALMGPEWARTRAAYNALARAATDDYFKQVVTEIFGAEGVAEIEDDPAMARLYEGVGVFFTHWNMRKPGALSDLLIWDKLDRKSWSMVKTPILSITSTGLPYVGKDSVLGHEAQTREDLIRAALVSTRSKPEFSRLYGSGKMLYPLARASKMCLDYVYKHLG
ncbi:hypothetical protein H4R99_001760 [Coemansia sp. RSA 1722]|nr:hypothetical protein H4R99_001760 [Coemansia sp. RSA 1722]